uniref:Uncharacterized protein n=1 Tax=Rhizophora mucronata TaxID=61149 RepID=A0A2P2NKJ7_RHIMU
MAFQHSNLVLYYFPLLLKQNNTLLNLGFEPSIAKKCAKY